MFNCVFMPWRISITAFAATKNNINTGNPTVSLFSIKTKIFLFKRPKFSYFRNKYLFPSIFSTKFDKTKITVFYPLPDKLVRGIDSKIWAGYIRIGWRFGKRVKHGCNTKYCRNINNILQSFRGLLNWSIKNIIKMLCN